MGTGGGLGWCLMPPATCGEEVSRGVRPEGEGLGGGGEEETQRRANEGVTSNLRPQAV